MLVLQVLAASHAHSLSMERSNRLVTFRFTGIDLPPNQNPPEGEGFVQFSVQPKQGLPTGTLIRNKASIVFDYNPAIETPEIIHVLAQPTYLPLVNR